MRIRLHLNDALETALVTIYERGQAQDPPLFGPPPANTTREYAASPVAAYALDSLHAANVPADVMRGCILRYHSQSHLPLGGINIMLNDSYRGVIADIAARYPNVITISRHSAIVCSAAVGWLYTHKSERGNHA